MTIIPFTIELNNIRLPITVPARTLDKRRFMNCHIPRPLLILVTTVSLSPIMQDINNGHDLILHVSVDWRRLVNRAMEDQEGVSLVALGGLAFSNAGNVTGLVPRTADYRERREATADRGVACDHGSQFSSVGLAVGVDAAFVNAQSLFEVR
jgi:hypothetical protein